MNTRIIFGFFVFLFALSACQPDEVTTSFDCPDVTPLELEKPYGFAPIQIPANNPLTREGVKLGRFLFYEKKLSGDNSMSCASCHLQEFGFAENKAFSTGIDGIEGDVSAMPIMNLVWHNYFFWDGRKLTLEEQAIDPVENVIELHETWPNVIDKLSADPKYVKMFKDAFCGGGITKENAAKALAQFERTLVSGNSKFDQAYKQDPINLPGLSQEAKDGFALFTNERGDCFHCHGYQANSGLFGGYGISELDVFRNNGLDSVYSGPTGREKATGNPKDRGKFKVASLRNIELTAPYMHDGRFKTLDEVIEFYNSGVVESPTIDHIMVKNGGVQKRNWTPYEKLALKEFLKSLTDETFWLDTTFSDPHK